jgi:hypothetical protein
MTRVVVLWVVVMVSASCGRSAAYEPRISPADASVAPASDSGSSCDLVTRDQAVQALSGLLSLGCAKSDCANISTSQDCAWGAMESLGALSPSEGGDCGLEDAMSRAEFIKVAVLSIQAFGFCQAPNKPTFSDTSVGAWYFDTVECAVQLGFVDPSEGRQFEPDKGLDRCFLTSVLGRIDRFLGTPQFLLVQADPGSVVPNNDMRVPVATYKAFGVTPQRPVQGIEYMNDLEGAFDTPVPPVVVSGIYLTCEKGEATTSNIESGVHVIPPFDGTFLYCQRQDRLPLTLTLSVHTFEAFHGESDSGMLFRFGLASVGPFSVLGGERIDPSLFRRSRPYVSVISGPSAMLVSGENDLLVIEVSADGAGDIGLARMAFQAKANLPLSNFRLYRDSVRVPTDQVNLFSDSVDLSSGRLVAGGTVVASFKHEEEVLASTSHQYRLTAEVASVPDGTAIATKLLGDVAMPSLKNPCHNPATGRVYGADGASLFTDDSWSRSVSQDDRNFIWTDRSASVHSYPAMGQGVAGAGSGSCDFTNGWGLGIESFPDRVLSK